MTKTKPSKLILALLAGFTHTPSVTWLCRHDNWKLAEILL